MGLNKGFKCSGLHLRSGVEVRPYARHAAAGDAATLVRHLYLFNTQVVQLEYPHPPEHKFTDREPLKTDPDLDVFHSNAVCSHGLPCQSPCCAHAAISRCCAMV